MAACSAHEIGFGPSDIALGESPDQILYLDVNKDGATDLVINANNLLVVELGFGDGTFATPQTYSAATGGGGANFSLASADFDGDGYPDFATVSAAGTVGLFAGSASGALTTESPVQVSGENAIIASDLNGDGKPDLAVFGSDAAVTVLTNTGSFSFSSTSVSLGSSSAPLALGAGDVNGDGLVDLVALGSTQVLVSLNSAVGFDAFQPVGSGLPAFATAAFALRDLNGDGVPDVLFGGDDGNAYLMLGDGKGSFGAATNLGGGQLVSDAAQFAFGDLNGDGLPEIVAQASADVVVYPSTKAGAWGTPYSFLPKVGNGTVGIADLFGTGRPDVLVTSAYTISVLQPAPTTLLAGETILPTTAGSFLKPIAADMNGDGHPDIVQVATSADQVAVSLNQGNGTFGAVAVSPVGTGASPSSVAAVDLNGDGKLDLVAASHGLSSVSVLLQTATSFAPVRQYPVTYFNDGSLVTGDFNGDGFPDVLSFGVGGFSFLAGSSTGTLAQEKTQASFGSNAVISELLTADVNKDGTLDVIALYSGPGVSALAVAIGLGKGDGTFIFGNPYGVDSGTLITLGDFNKDGFVDVMSLASSGSLAFCPGDGTSNVSCTTVLSIGDGAGLMVPGDFDGDGNLDLLFSGGGVGVSVWRGDGKGGFSAAFSRAAYLYVDDVATGDFTGDGRPSIFFPFSSGSYGLMLNFCK